MEYAAGVIALTGLVTGLRFQLKVLLSVVAVLLFGTLAFALVRRLPFSEALLTVFGAQLLVQTGYFLGAIIRYVIASTRRTLLSL